MIRRAVTLLVLEVPLAALLCAGLWGSVHFMLAMLSLFDPSRVPQ